MAENDPGVLDQIKAWYMMNDPNIAANLKLRERIALAQMSRRSAFPKNVGEGLMSIGNDISDAWTARRLEAMDAAGAKEAGGYTGPPVAGAPAAAPPPVRRSYAPEDANTVVPAEQPQVRPVTPPLLPAVPLPPDQQQSDEPGAPVRMPSAAATQDWRNANPLPSIARPPVPPQQPPPPPPPGEQGNQVTRQVPLRPPPFQQPAPPPPLPPAETAPAPPFGPGGRFDQAFPGRQSALPGAPVMAEGNEPSAEEMNAGRNALAQALMQQQAARGGPQPLPTTRAVTPPPAGGDTGIRAAPQPAPVQAMPVQPGAVVGWVPESPTSKPRERPLVGMSQEEADLTRDLAIKVQRNPYMAQSPAAMRLQTLQRDREARQKDADKVWEAQITRETEQAKQHLDARRGQAEAIQKYGTGELEQEQKRLAIEDAREKSILQSRFGGRDPEKVFTEFDTDRESARKTKHALTQYRLAQDMIKDGVITGTGQGWKVSAAKVAAAFGHQNSADAIAHTEQLQAALKSTLALAVENIQGAGGKVSDTDVRIAEGTIGADPNLQLQTINNLVKRGEAAATQKLESYNQNIEKYLGGTRAADRYRVQAPSPRAATETATSTPAASTPAAGQTPEAVAADGTILVVRNGKWVPK